MPAHKRRACRAPAVAPCPAPAGGPRALALSLDELLPDLLPWLRGIWVGVCRDYRIPSNSASGEEVEGCALCALVELTHRFDESRLPPGGDALKAFMGWAAVEVRSRCRREAVRLRNGGTFPTSGDKAANRMRVRPLPRARSAGGAPGEVALCRDLRRPEPEEDADEPWTVWDTTWEA